MKEKQEKSELNTSEIRNAEEILSNIYHIPAAENFKSELRSKIIIEAKKHTSMRTWLFLNLRYFAIPFTFVILVGISVSILGNYTAMSKNSYQPNMITNSPMMNKEITEDVQNEKGYGGISSSELFLESETKDGSNTEEILKTQLVGVYDMNTATGIGDTSGIVALYIVNAVISIVLIIIAAVVIAKTKIKSNYKILIFIAIILLIIVLIVVADYYFIEHNQFTVLPAL